MSFSQDRDFQSWYAFELDYNIFKKTQFSINNEVRLRENSTVYSRYFTDFSLKRKYNKYFSYAAGYRFLVDKDTNLEIKNRFYTDIYIKRNLLQRLNCNVRTRCQTQGDTSGYKTKFRQKFKFNYDVKKIKLDLLVAFEYFYSFEDKIEKFRYSFGFIKPLSKKVDLNLNYILQKEFNSTSPQPISILRCKFSYDI